MDLNNPKLNIVLVGIGLIGSKHASLLQRSKRSRLISIVAPPSPHNLDAIETFGVPRFDKLEDAIANGPVDGVILASPNQFHTEQAAVCITRKIPCLVEKPLAASLESAKHICDLALEFGTPVLVGHHRTHSPLLPLARDIINSPQFGKLIALNGSALFRKPDHYFDDGPWRKYIGGGPILINLIHDIGIMQYLCGPISAVWSMSTNKNRGFEVEDTVSVMMEFANGALGTFLLSDIAASNQSWEMTSGENPAYPYHSDANCYHFVGANGSLDFPTLNYRFYQDDQAPSWWNKFQMAQTEHDRADPLEVQLRHFESVIQGEAEPVVPAIAGFENMRVLEAINSSIRTGKKVNVADVMC